MAAQPALKVFFEPVATAAPRSLYFARDRLPAIAYAGAISDGGRRAYDTDGVLLVHTVFEPVDVEAAKTELAAMTLADHPGCEAIWYEGGIRAHIPLDATKDHGAAAGALSDPFALGQESDRLPTVPRETRARYVRKLMGFLDTHAALHAIAWHPRLISLVRAMLGDAPRLLQEMAMIKPPGGREKPWHQDHAYFNVGLDERIIGVWIPLEEATPENGCMYAIRGGHKAGPRPHFKLRDWQLCDTDVEGDTRVALPMQPGEVMIFDGKLPHGTPVNRTNDFRWALQFHYIAAAAAETSDDARLAAFGAEGKGVTC
jgi:Phytanoyl-CoA dioxygenase (PhyH)